MRLSARRAALLIAATTLGAGASAAACGGDDVTVLPPDSGAAGDASLGTPDGAAPALDAGTAPDAATGPLGSTLRPTFTFEGGPVRPVAMSPDGSHLFVANTSNASLDIFTVSAAGITAAGSTYVGVEPVAVAARTNTEVWVVNHVSDSVSIVDTSTSPPHVVRTLLVGDEPSDIVFGGTGNARAFITTAHRGQQRTEPSIGAVKGAGDPQLTTPGIGRADVWVFDSANLGTTVGGTPASIVTLFGDTPRALAVTPDGKTVYAAVFKSGNQSMSTSSELPCAGFNESADASTPCTVQGVTVPGSPPTPPTNYKGIASPAVSMILKMDANGVWRDLLGRDWTAATAFTLPDEDVFAIDTTSLMTTATYLHVGTTLFDMAVNPANGNVYVSNTEARNDLRFEGPGTYVKTTLEGHLAESRVTVLSGTAVTPRSLNKHIDYSKLPAPSGTADHSLSTPTNIAVSSDGATMYIAAFGSSKIGVLPTAAVENDSFDPTSASASYITVSGGGPSGIVIDDANRRLYVSTRFDDGLSVVDLKTGKETSHVSLTNVEPAKVTKGRSFLYDAKVSSSNGEAACASCHMFGDDDHMVWDLSAPDGDVVDSPITVKLQIGAGRGINGTGKVNQLHPIKGPMATQTLRGTINHGPMHWRGDRVAGAFGTDTRTAPPYDSELAFKNFIGAFNTLLGLGSAFSQADMQTFADFALAITMPPNPVRALDNSLTPTQSEGRTFYLGCSGPDSMTGLPVKCTDGEPPDGGGHFADGIGVQTLGFACQGCHTLNPAMGFFGTDGESSFENLPQTMKVPELRNLYDKVGMFGAPAVRNSNAIGNGQMGAQVRGTGFTHDGSVDTLFHFLQANVFNDTGVHTGFTNGDTDRRNVEQFLLAYDSDLAPIVGQQVTLRSDNASAVAARIALLIARAKTPFVSQILGPSPTECDLVARANVGGASIAYRMQRDGSFLPSNAAATITDAQLRAVATTPGQEVTYTCFPPGWLQ